MILPRTFLQTTEAEGTKNVNDKLPDRYRRRNFKSKYSSEISLISAAHLLGYHLKLHCRTHFETTSWLVGPYRRYGFFPQMCLVKNSVGFQETLWSNDMNFKGTTMANLNTMTGQATRNTVFLPFDTTTLWPRECVNSYHAGLMFTQII